VADPRLGLSVLRELEGRRASTEEPDELVDEQVLVSGTGR
jgi:hypothetical protein